MGSGVTMLTGCYEPMGTRFYELHANSSAATRRSLYPRRLFFGSSPLPLSPSFFFVSMPPKPPTTRFHQHPYARPRAWLAFIRPSFFCFFFLFPLFFSSSQFSKVQRALIIEEAGANNPAGSPCVQAEGRRGVEEWWKATTIVVAWIQRTTDSWWPSTRRTETGREFSSC